MTLQCLACADFIYQDVECRTRDLLGLNLKSREKETERCSLFLNMWCLKCSKSLKVRYLIGRYVLKFLVGRYILNGSGNKGGEVWLRVKH